MPPVAVGQIRRDPDPRMRGRCVRVVKMHVESVGHRKPGMAALVENVHRSDTSGAWYASGTPCTRILLARLERWEVVGG